MGKKRAVKTILQLCLIIILVSGVLGNQKVQAQIATVGGITYRLDVVSVGDPKATVTGCSASGNVVIPSEFSYGDSNLGERKYRVWCIATGAFKDNTEIKSITIPSSVYEIYYDAFSGCTGLKEVIFSDIKDPILTERNEEIRLINVRSAWFQGLPLERIYLGRNFETKTGYYPQPVFGDIKTDFTLEIGPTVSNLFSSFFKGSTGLKELSIPSSVKVIGASTFEGCEGLTSVIIPSALTYIGSKAFKDCRNLKALNIEDGTEKLEIGSSVFEPCSVEKLYLGRELDLLGNGSPFTGSSLSEVEFGKDLAFLDNATFADCTGLTEVRLPNKLKRISNSLFRGCTGLRSIHITEGVTEIFTEAFRGCTALSEVSFPETLEKIGDFAFEGCTSLTEIHFPATLKLIGNYSFSPAKLKEVSCKSKTPPSYYYINAFSSYTYDHAYLSVPEGSLKSYKEVWGEFSHIIEEGDRLDLTIEVTRAGQLKNLVPFDKMANVTGLTLKGKLNSTDILTLNTMLNNISRLDMREAEIVEGGDPYYEDENMRLEVKDDELGEYWAYNLSCLESVLLPETVTRIGGYSFYGKRRLKHVELNSRLKRIEKGGFAQCEELAEIVIPDSVTFIGSSAFSECKSLKNVKLPNKLHYIRNNVFGDCTSLGEIHLPSSITVIDNYSFSNCEKLEAVEFPLGLTEIGYEAFYGCKSLKKIELPYKLLTLGNQAFSACLNLKKIILPGSLRNIGEECFASCPGISSVEILNPIPPSIGPDVFDSTVGQASLYVPEGSATTYYLSPGWSKFGSIESSEFPEASEFISEGFKFRVTSSYSHTCEVVGVDEGRSLRGENRDELIIPSEAEYDGSVYHVNGVANGAFRNLTMSGLRLPESISYVGLMSFVDCGNLTSIECASEVPPAVHTDSFDEDIYDRCQLYVPSQHIEKYGEDPVWGRFDVKQPPVKVEEIIIDPLEWKGKIGEEKQLTAVISPADATDKTLLWTSSDLSVAVVGSNGKVKALNPGEAIITVTAADGSGVSAECRVEVEEPVTYPEPVVDHLYITGDGDFPNGTWQAYDPDELKYVEGYFTIVVDNLSAFKLSTECGDWDTFNSYALTCDYGFEADVPVHLVAGDSNIHCPAKGTWTVKISHDLSTIILETEEDYEPLLPWNLSFYVRGDFTDWGVEQAWKLERLGEDSEGCWIYSCHYSGGTEPAANDKFKITSEDWSIVFGSDKEELVVMNKEIETVGSFTARNFNMGEPFNGILYAKFKFNSGNFGKGRIYLTNDPLEECPFPYGSQTGIDNHPDGEMEEDVYYTLQGLRIANPGRGIYIVKRGNKVSKVCKN